MALIQQQISELITPTVEDLGYQVWGVEYIKSRNSTLRVYIDKEDGIITIDDCSIVSQHLSSLLDVEDLIEEEYNLEISSPGLDRPLFTPDQYQRYLGEYCELHLRMPVENKRKWKGKIIDVTPTSVTLDVTEKPKLKPTKAKKIKPEKASVNQQTEVATQDPQPQVQTFLFPNIGKARLEPQF